MPGGYVNPFEAQEEIFTDNQTVMYVLMNFGMAIILLVAVNSNIDAACASDLKYWLVIFAMINVIGGFAVTHRMLAMFKKKR